jgi:phosphate transport system protein
VPSVEQLVLVLFGRVTEAVAQATSALLDGDVLLGQTVIDADRAIDQQTEVVGQLVWAQIDSQHPTPTELRHLVAVLLVLPELERSADLAEHIAQRAVENLGTSMSPRSRGIVQLMTEVANEMWQQAADAFGDRNRIAERLNTADEEMDILHENLTREVAEEDMPVPIAAQVTLLGRFYERLGDHAVNLARRIELLADTRP